MLYYLQRQMWLLQVLVIITISSWRVEVQLGPLLVLAYDRHVHGTPRAPGVHRRDEHVEEARRAPGDRHRRRPPPLAHQRPGAGAILFRRTPLDHREGGGGGGGRRGARRRGAVGSAGRALEGRLHLLQGADTLVRRGRGRRRRVQLRDEGGGGWWR